MVYTFVCDRDVARLYAYLDIVKTVLMVEVDICHDSKCRYNFVGDVFHELFAVLDAHDFSFVIDANEDSASVSIGNDLSKSVLSSYFGIS